MNRSAGWSDVGGGAEGRRAFTIMEVLVVIGLVAILASLAFPVLLARKETARIDEARGQLRVIEAALAQYQSRLRSLPPSAGQGDNAGAENLLWYVRPFLQPEWARRWSGDTDGDGRLELLDPWGNPWVYFNHADYVRGGADYVIGRRRVSVKPAKSLDAFANAATYQLWACGQNETDEEGSEDDIGNLGK